VAKITPEMIEAKERCNDCIWCGSTYCIHECSGPGCDDMESLVPNDDKMPEVER